MEEITTSLKTDTSLSSSDILCSVDDMMFQVKDVIDYALKMLNNVLDISKISSGVFQAQKKPFDVQDVVTRATRMQQAKVTREGVKMSFVPNPERCIAMSDGDIVERIIATLIR